MKLIVTGAAGFIGSCLLWKLNQKGITDIVAADHLGESLKWKNLTGKKFRDYIEKDDFLDLVSTGKIGKVDRFVNFARTLSKIQPYFWRKLPH